ncbi:hypothetical protein FQN57_005736 [Myotisia sp. PD_48]|nr:hypothetical protein FQN57_005736 [Myotisia sp. PD_48]
MSGASDNALDQLQEDQRKLLDKIDELRAIGIGGLVELPQLIVCGNQSSGKSSVLEAISRVRFPAKSNICTRFATEVVLRRDPFSKIKISIEPGLSRVDEEEKKKLRSFAYEKFSSYEDLPALIEKAKDHMGIMKSTKSGFSDDILRVEISGPEKPELTLVDLPGLYTSTSQDQGKEGIEMVHDLTMKYMKNPRSIILAVIGAKTDYHQQRVLNIAEEFDPKRERTLGIITQPDILEANSEEEDIYLQFIKNQKISLQLGWHVLRNRSFETRDTSDDARDEREKNFFNTGRWISLPHECVGIKTLRRRLSGILFKHIRKNLPGLVADIQEKVLDREQKLSKLGPARSTLRQQRGYLLSISSRFERIAGQALDGMYADEFFGGLDENTSTDEYRRLRAVIRQLNEYFVEAITIRGCRRTIVEDSEPFPPKPIAASLKASAKPYMDDWEPEYIHRKALELEVGEQARKHRGIELPGNANQLLVGSLFRDQSKPWEDMAKRHMLNTWDSVRYFVSLVMQYLTNEHTYSLLVGSVIEPELEKMRQALLRKLDELTAYTKRGHPLPVGRSFLAQIQKARSDRLLEALKGNLTSSKAQPTDGSLNFSMKAIEQATVDIESSRDEYAAAEIVDQAQAYYDTAILTFVDNVAILGVENCLLDPLQRVFTSQTINNMDDGQIKDLAIEPPHIHEERERLGGELEKLKAGLRSLCHLSPMGLSIGAQPLFAAKNPTTKPTVLVASASTTSSDTSTPGEGQPFVFDKADIDKSSSFISNSNIFGHFVGGTSSNTNGTAGSSAIENSSPRPIKYPRTRNLRENNCRIYLETLDSADKQTCGQHICFIPSFDKYSPEELRVGDYSHEVNPCQSQRWKGLLSIRALTILVGLVAISCLAFAVTEHDPKGDFYADGSGAIGPGFPLGALAFGVLWSISSLIVTLLFDTFIPPPAPITLDLISSLAIAALGIIGLELMVHVGAYGSCFRDDDICARGRTLQGVETFGIAVTLVDGGLTTAKASLNDPSLTFIDLRPFDTPVTVIQSHILAEQISKASSVFKYILQWSLYKLSRTPYALAAVRKELDEVLGPKSRPSLGHQSTAGRGRREAFKTPIHICCHQINATVPSSRWLGSIGTSRKWIPPTDKEGSLCVDGQVLLYVCHYLVQRDPEVYGETADVWMPERWLGQSSTASED